MPLNIYRVLKTDTTNLQRERLRQLGFFPADDYLHYFPKDYDDLIRTKKVLREIKVKFMLRYCSTKV